MQVKIAGYEEFRLAALCEVQALSPGRAAEDRDLRFDGVSVVIDDGRVEVAPAAGNRPRVTGIALDLEKVVAGGAPDEGAEPPKAFD